MRPVVTIEELLAAPVGRYFTGRWFLIWVYSPSLIGTAYFGVPDPRDFAALERAFGLLDHRALAPRYDVLVDAAGVAEAIPLEAFAFLGRYLGVAKESSARMRRIAIVRPGGMFGATLAGVFYDVIRASFAAAMFADRGEAAHWLDHAGAAVVCPELDALVDDVRATPQVVRRLRAYLQTRLGAPDLFAAARDLGVSTRSLQRALRDAGTSFRAQVEHARMRAAERLLVDTDEKIETVARTVGFARLACFATAFRRVAGESPSQFRARRSA
jgi:AraC-like DNA-binding protein